MTESATLFLSAAEIAAAKLPGLPQTKAGVHAHAERHCWRAGEEGSGWRWRSGTGGGVEYNITLLPQPAQVALALKMAPRPERVADPAHDDEWTYFEALPRAKRAAAEQRLRVLEAWGDQSARDGVAAAARAVGRAHGVSVSTLYAWDALVAGVPRPHWLPYLAPRHGGSQARSPLSPEAWDFIRADYLRRESPRFEACYRRLAEAAAAHGWTIPPARTLRRRLAALPATVRVAEREGDEALKRLYPAQIRDRGVFHALEAVNADFHKFDVFVKWPDGRVLRPQMIAFQDLYSGKLLAWRVDTDPNQEGVRLAFGDLVRRFGIPAHCWMDNGREFASKWITGGVANRYRFKVQPTEPFGVMTQLGVQVHWTTPYAGQSKPIERAFRDLAENVAKHPEFAGAYTGNTVLAKPENYGARAVPLERFLAVLEGAITEHNAREGRRTAVCAGRSFDAAFADSYAGALIQRASAAQLRLWLTAAEGVRVSATDGTCTLLGNRYHAMFLHQHLGRRVVVRFDPQKLHDGVEVYTLDGTYLGAAACVEAVGFADTDAARAHARARAEWKRGVKLQAAAEKRLSIEQVAALLPRPESAPAPETRVVRPVFPRREGTANAPLEEGDDRIIEAVRLNAERLKRARQA